MARRLTARQGDTVELLLWRELRLKADALTAVFDANPGLADAGMVLPLGTVVTVPDAVTVAATSTDTPARPLIQLWD